jgi:hypothetical protein
MTLDPNAPANCPGCANAMQSMTLPRQLIGEETVDLCFACRALWFDEHESSQLSPGATLQLFDAIAKTAPGAGTAMPARLPCPRCAEPLALTQDLQRSTRFSYYRCPYGHGRFTPFFQFLREKNFVRPLSPAELERLKSAIRVVRCSSCGAPVNLERDAVCAYCRAPIAIVDPDAVAAAVSTLQAAETRRKSFNADTYVDAMLEAQRTRYGPLGQAPGTQDTPSHTFDLVYLGLVALSALAGS